MRVCTAGRYTAVNGKNMRAYFPGTTVVIIIKLNKKPFQILRNKKYDDRRRTFSSRDVRY